MWSAFLESAGEIKRIIRLENSKITDSKILRLRKRLIIAIPNL